MPMKDYPRNLYIYYSRIFECKDLLRIYKFNEFKDIICVKIYNISNALQTAIAFYKHL